MINIQMIQRNLYLKNLYLMLFDKEDHSCVTSCVITYLNVVLSSVVSNQNIAIIIYQKIPMNDQKEENGLCLSSISFHTWLQFYFLPINFKFIYFSSNALQLDENNVFFKRPPSTTLNRNNNNKNKTNKNEN